MKLTDKDKKKIIADYVECQNYSEVARHFKVSRTTVQNVVGACGETCKLLQEKKEQNTVDILVYMETRKQAVCDLVQTYLNALVDPEKIEKATVSQLSTALGTVIDKFTWKDKKDSGEIDRGDRVQLNISVKGCGGEHDS